MDPQQQLFGLMAVAEEHQKAVQAAIAGLEAERAAIAQERAALKAATAAIEPTVAGAMTNSMAGASETAAAALSAATKPILGRLSGVVNAAAEAEDKLHGAVSAFGWKWAAIAGGAAAGGVFALILAAWISVWWQRDQVEALQAQRLALADDVAQLQNNVAALEKRGGRAITSTCGGRICVRVDMSSAAWGESKDYMILKTR